jgi:oligosaccharide repeat unit polymerase
MTKTQGGMTRPASITALSTTTLLCGLALTGLSLTSNHAVGVFTPAAIGIGLSLCLATGIEATAGVRSLIRVDILTLWVLYGLTFLEFLFPQPDIDALVSPEAATSGAYAVLLGFAGLALGRHLVPRRRGYTQSSGSIHVPPASIFLLFILATLLGYLHICLAVNFDLFEALRQMSLPRFAQSWSRGRYGDVYALLYEIGALIYLIPPIAGLIYARSQDYNLIQRAVVTVVLLFTFYFGFASGTRNIIATYIITFLGAYLLTKSDLKFRQVLYFGVPTLFIMLLGMSYMLAFRGGGLGNYSFADASPNTLYIDHNMVIISRITEMFPNLYGFLGLEIPYYGLVHPIPRALWPGKPDSLSVSIEAALGADPETVTFTSTFVGEAYMSGGLLAVLVAGLMLGAVAGLWNRVGSNEKSPFAQLLYASGFLCAALTMRSTSWMSVMALPTLALWIYGKLLHTSSSSSPRPITIRSDDR